MNAPDLSGLNTPTIIVFAVLGLMSLISISVTFYKTFQFGRMGVGKTSQAEDILQDWLGGRADDAFAAAAANVNRSSPACYNLSSPAYAHGPTHQISPKS